MDPNDWPQSTKMVTYWHDLEIEQIDKLACKQMHSKVNFMFKGSVHDELNSK